MKGRIIFIFLGLMVALFCLVMVCMAAWAGDKGGVFLFGAPTIASVAQTMRKCPGGKTIENKEGSKGIRFIPHGQLMAMIAIQSSGDSL